MEIWLEVDENGVEHEVIYRQPPRVKVEKVQPALLNRDIYVSRTFHVDKELLDTFLKHCQRFGHGGVKKEINNAIRYYLEHGVSR